MAVSDYVPDPDSAFAELLEHVRDNHTPYITTLEITPGEITTITNDAVNFRFLLTQQERLIAAGKQSTEGKNSLRYGDIAHPNTPISLAFPSQPATVPSPVTPGVEKRFRDFIARLKSHRNYTKTIGDALHIEGAEITGPDLINSAPDLTGAKVVAGEVRIPWKKNGFQGIRIEVDRADGKGWVFLAVDTKPGYVDTEPHPATVTIWKYRAFYIMDDQKVGQCSAVVEVKVGG
ncbi:MAG: hypothetical protein RL088_2448 [Verrucomicrobiota bacterium]|jgi:hypothetical protein